MRSFLRFAWIALLGVSACARAPATPPVEASSSGGEAPATYVVVPQRLHDADASMALSPDGRWLAMASRYAMSLTEVSTGLTRVMSSTDNGAYSSVEVDWYDERVVSLDVTGDDVGRMRTYWSIEDGALGTLDWPYDSDDEPPAVAVVAGRIFAGASDGEQPSLSTVRMRTADDHAADGEDPRSVELPGLYGEVTSLLASPDGRLLAVGTSGGDVALVDVATLALVRTDSGEPDAVDDDVALDPVLLGFAPGGALAWRADRALVVVGAVETRRVFAACEQVERDIDCVYADCEPIGAGVLDLVTTTIRAGSTCPLLDAAAIDVASLGARLASAREHSVWGTSIAGGVATVQQREEAFAFSPSGVEQIDEPAEQPEDEPEEEYYESEEDEEEARLAAIEEADSVEANEGAECWIARDDQGGLALRTPTGEDAPLGIEAPLYSATHIAGGCARIVVRRAESAELLVRASPSEPFRVMARIDGAWQGSRIVLGRLLLEGRDGAVALVDLESPEHRWTTAAKPSCGAVMAIDGELAVPRADEVVLVSLATLEARTIALAADPEGCPSLHATSASIVITEGTHVAVHRRSDLTETAAYELPAPGLVRASLVVVCDEHRLEVRELETGRVLRSASAPCELSVTGDERFYLVREHERGRPILERIVDGARLELFVLTGETMIVAAATPLGALWTPEPEGLVDFVLRAEGPLLTAPLVSGEELARRFYQPTLLSDFFEGRPLPVPRSE